MRINDGMTISTAPVSLPPPTPPEVIELNKIETQLAFNVLQAQTDAQLAARAQQQEVAVQTAIAALPPTATTQQVEAAKTTALLSVATKPVLYDTAEATRVALLATAAQRIQLAKDQAAAAAAAAAATRSTITTRDSGFFTQLADGLGGIINSGAQVLSQVGTAVGIPQVDLSGISRDIQNVVMPAVQTADDIIEDVSESAVVSAVAGGDLLLDAANAAGEAGSAFVDTVGDVIGDAGTGIQDFMNDLGEGASGLIGGLEQGLGDMAQSGEDLLDGIGDAIKWAPIIAIGGLVTVTLVGVVVYKAVQEQKNSPQAMQRHATRHKSYVALSQKAAYETRNEITRTQDRAAKMLPMFI